MFKQIGIVVLGIYFLSFASLSYAEYTKVKAIGSIETKFTKAATTDQKKLVLEDAKRKALDKYISGLNPQRIEILNSIKDDLYKNINTYVPEIITLDDGRWENGYWIVDVEASIDEAQIENLVNKYIQASTKKKEETYLTFVFVAREVESVKEFKGDKTEKVVESGVYGEKLGIDEKANVVANENLAVTDNEKLDQNKKNKPGIISKGTTEDVNYQGEATAKYQGDGAVKYQGNLSDQRNGTYEKTTGSSVEKKSEVVRYRIYTSEEIETKVA